MFKHSEQAITHIRGCRGDSNQYSTLQGYKLDNTTHAGPEDTTTGNRSQHSQRVGPGPISP
jgi:hypothetical protein